MTNSSNPLRNLLAQRHTPPFRHQLTSKTHAILTAESFSRRQQQNFKLLKRWLLFKTSGQSGLLRAHLPAPPARILWLNFLNNRIGDSIMDLSGRALLGAFKVDLLTSKSQAELFNTDRYFEKVFTDPAAIDPTRYDFALVDYINTGSLRLKCKWFPKLPFASIYGFFSGPEVNRTLFSCYRIHHLLQYPHSNEQLQPFLTPRIFIEDEPSPLPAKEGRKRVALVLGGLSPYRTYGKWAEMIRCLRIIWPLGKPFPQFILVGSENGRQFIRTTRL
jgi:heptosyltransferase-2